MVFTYNLINVKTGEVKEDLKPSTIGAILNINSNDVNHYARQGWTYDNTYRIEINRIIESENVNAFPKALLAEWDEVTSKLRRYQNGK